MLAAGGYYQTFGHYRNTFGVHVLAQLLAQGRITFGGTVLQHRAGVVGEHRSGGFTQSIHIKQRRIRKTTSKTDNAGLAQQFEQFTNGGGFYVV